MTSIMLTLFIINKYINPLMAPCNFQVTYTNILAFYQIIIAFSQNGVYVLLYKISEITTNNTSQNYQPEISKLKPCRLSADRNQRNQLVQLTLFALQSVFTKQEKAYIIVCISVTL